MARKAIEKVNEDMLKDMMMSDIPLWASGAGKWDAGNISGRGSNCGS